MFSESGLNALKKAECFVKQAETILAEVAGTDPEIESRHMYELKSLAAGLRASIDEHAGDAYCQKCSEAENPGRGEYTQTEGGFPP